ncbi:FAD-dependent oxidoreductase [Nocardiopsis lambiniae]|uniref:FAD-dependent oxidoreductase n=1 Tax=Nocardiopsis lambiniae TaxID=3075539 RepID=A0ABU2MD86_9ACTN|nr:FAD-dependent oxidoreductase [Nocardiopsis sp. DSM 44743]MDT0330647.1 FAD-dependent oxidoreductase [Nocardiopsis sp. DSM 44743]
MRALIVGAGIAGLTLAHRLSHHGWDVTLVERAPGPRPQGYMIDFFGPGYDAAEAMGILPRLRERGHHITEAVLVDEDGRPRASMGFERFARSLGGSLISIMRPDLELTLSEALPPGVEVRYGTGPRQITEHADGVRVTLDDGRTLEADLLVGADGIHSTVRDMVFGPEERYLHHLGFHTAAYTFDDARIHAATRGRFHLTDSLGAQMGLYALEGERVAAFTVHRTPDTTLPADPREALRRTYAGLGWVVPRALEACPPPEEVYYDHVAQIRMERWSSGRTVLLGDACQAVSLLAGQGASLGMGGAYVLGAELARADDVAEGLRRYERRWRPVVEERQRAALTGTSWFLPDTPARLRLRRMFLRLAALPGVDRWVASSLSGKPTRVVKDLVPVTTPGD